MAKPLASIILLTFNQENLVEESIDSLLNQTYSPLEIIISDDLSSDRTREKIRSKISQYHGPHEIKVIFNDSNVGLCQNINQAIEHCQGEFIFAAAGDDISLPNRCEIVMSEWLKLNKQPGLIATDAYDMAIDGHILGIKRTSILQEYKGLQDWIKRPPYFFGSSHSWSRNFLNKFPPLNPKMMAEDHLMVFRALISDGGYTISEPLVKHRRGGVTLKRYIDLATKAKILRVGFNDKYIYLKQLLSDAQHDHHFSELEKHLHPELQECQLTLDLYQLKDPIKKIIRCFANDGVSFFFKMRMLTYTTFPWVLQPIFKLKKLIKRY
ncbi:glycosyltransferase [Polynucleobacter sp. 30F-ANTBAC]|uniref:glycosyltransferase n=1 Tax=Polynucleobacter sp. 30F-ANTBAC TaxID=2689095 RepID=UPI001C0CF11D|nr:glycosyltransferase [Polynucleobacter sp. 30F-ANTBAC]MBU3599636.1 glycosyltransferase [Polynucleobacter sp. 30F-ANTBAC]